jgi:hypothetical protein
VWRYLPSCLQIKHFPLVSKYFHIFSLLIETPFVLSVIALLWAGQKRTDEADSGWQRRHAICMCEKSIAITKQISPPLTNCEPKDHVLSYNVKLKSDTQKYRKMKTKWYLYELYCHHVPFVTSKATVKGVCIIDSIWRQRAMEKSRKVFG